MSRAIRLWGALALVLCLVAVSGCAVRTDDVPRDIDEGQRGILSDPAATDAAPPVGGRRIFLVTSDSSGALLLLRSVPRDVGSTAQDVLTALLAGPTAKEQADRYRTAIPQGTLLLGTRFVAEGTLEVDLSPAMFDATGDTLIDAVAQVVFTAHELDGVERVRLLVDGSAQSWPRGDGVIVSRPLTIYDYPDRVFSTQPAFPALPTRSG